MEAKEEEMSTKNFMRGLVDQIQNNQLPTFNDVKPSSSSSKSSKSKDSEKKKKKHDVPKNQTNEGASKELDLEAYKNRILGGMVGGDTEETSASEEKTESAPQTSSMPVQNAAYNVVQSLSICQSFPKFSTFDSESSEANGQSQTEASTTSGAATTSYVSADNASAAYDSTGTADNAQAPMRGRGYPRMQMYRPRFTPETQLITKAIRFFAPKLGGVRPNLDPRGGVPHTGSAPFTRNRQPNANAAGSMRPQMNPNHPYGGPTMRPYGAMGHRVPMPMTRHGVPMVRAMNQRPMGFRNPNMGMMQPRPMQPNPGRGYAPAPFSPVRTARPAFQQRNGPSPFRPRMAQPADTFVDDDTGTMNSFSESSNLNLTTL